jgi:hypothetical protein
LCLCEDFEDFWSYAHIDTSSTESGSYGAENVLICACAEKSSQSSQVSRKALTALRFFDCEDFETSSQVLAVLGCASATSAALRVRQRSSRILRMTT